MSTKGKISIGTATIILALANIFGRGLGFIREVVFARTFGATENFDIYLVGAVIPTIINTIVFYFSQNVFIPTYHKLAAVDEKKAERYSSTYFTVFLIAGVIAGVLLYLSRDFILSLYLTNYSPLGVNEVKDILTIFCFAIPLMFVLSFLAAYLIAKYKYAYSAFPRLVMNVGIILSVLLLSGELRVLSIPIGYLIGLSLQFLMLLYFSVSKASFKLKLQFSEIASISFSIFLVTILIEILNNFHLLIDRYFVNFIEGGGISALNYSSILINTPNSIFSFALALALFPTLAEDFNKANIKDLRKSFVSASGLILYIFIPLSLVYYIYNAEIITLIFQGGAFDAEATKQTAQVLKVFAIYLPLYAVFSIVAKLIYSTGLNVYLLVISVLAIAIKVVLNFMLVEEYMHEGLAISSTVTFVFMSLAGLILVSFKLKLNVLKNVTYKVGLVFLYALGSHYGASFICKHLLPKSEYSVYLELVLFAILYILIGFAYKSEEFKLLRKFILEKLPQKK